MPLTSARLKRTAKQIIRVSKPSAISVAAIYCVLSIILSLLSSRLLNAGFTESRYRWFMSYVQSGQMEQATQILLDMLPSGSEVVVYLLLEVSIAVVAVGFDIFLLRTVRGDNPSFGNLLDGFGFIGRIILLNILTGLFVSLWSILFVIPGIIAAYSYSLSTYLLIDHPEYSVMDCIRESKRMMQGHKAERFSLDLSFLGWMFLILLSSLPGLWLLSGIQIWTVPYMNMTFVLYYEVLRTGGIHPAIPPETDNSNFYL